MFNKPRQLAEYSIYCGELVRTRLDHVHFTQLTFKEIVSIFYRKLPYDVDPEQAMEHPEVRTKVDAAISRLTAATDRFLQSITASVDKIP